MTTILSPETLVAK